MNPEVFANLQSVLAHLYPDENSIRRVCNDAGLSLSRVALNSSPINNWFAVLTEAAKVNQVSNLLDVIEREYGGNKEIREVFDRCRLVLSQVGNGLHVAQSLLPQITNVIQPTRIIFEDGGAEADEQSIYEPRPQFDHTLLRELEAPGGAVKLRDKFYIERMDDMVLREQLLKWGSTTTIRAPRQTGKTSLLMRGIHFAGQHNIASMFIDLQSFAQEQLLSLDIFLHHFASVICEELDVEQAVIETAWRGSLGAPQKLTRFLAKQILPLFDNPVVLAIDEADKLLQTSFAQSFFALIRHWQSRQVSHPNPWEKLNIVMVISTEPNLLISSMDQSPFNVGERLNLLDFTEEQVNDLNQRHGSPLTKHALLTCLNLLGGHPYLTRKALYEMVKRGLSWEDLQRQAATDQGIFDQHLQRLIWSINQAELKNALRTVIRTQRCPDETALSRLLRAGVIKGSGDHFTCRCKLYESYLKSKLL